MVHTPEATVDLTAVRARLAERRVALVHDWVTGYRGGEKVLAAIAALVPQADLHTLVYVKGAAVPVIERRRVRPSALDRLPGVARYYRWLLPAFPGWADRLDLRGYDLVLSTSHCVAKGVRARDGAAHVCYCHTPMRYVWDRFDDYFGHHRGPLRWVLEREAARLRAWDRATASRVDHWQANSSFVRDRILRCYGVDATKVEVLPPPVDVDHFTKPVVGTTPEDRYLVVSALVPYKRIDHAVEACARTGRRLDVAGDGPELERLRQLARRHGATDRIRFLGFVADDALPGLMATRRALLFPGVEDFGITPLEATAAGLPVIARGEGGALDTVAPGLNGWLYDGDSVEALVQALDEFEGAGAAYERAAMVEWASRFAPARFEERYLRSVAPWLEGTGAAAVGH